MPSLIRSAPRERQQLNMNSAGQREKTAKAGKLRSRLHCRFLRSSSSNRLCFEDLSQWSQSLEKLLASKYGMVTFQAFLKSEFSDENIEFWLVCEDYKKIKSSYKMSSRAKKIFKLYIQAEAPREINIDHKTRDLVKRNLQAPTSMCFDHAQRIVYGLMERDSYPRFLKSDTYRTLMESSLSYIKM